MKPKALPKLAFLALPQKLVSCPPPPKVAVACTWSSLTSFGAGLLEPAIFWGSLFWGAFHLLFAHFVLVISPLFMVSFGLSLLFSLRLIFFLHFFFGLFVSSLFYHLLNVQLYLYCSFFCYLLFYFSSLLRLYWFIVYLCLFFFWGGGVPLRMLVGEY